MNYTLWPLVSCLLLASLPLLQACQASRPGASATPVGTAVEGKFVVDYTLSDIFDIAVDPERFFHGPAAVVAPNGDWLVAYQDSLDDPGHDSYISQVRSRDSGKTWMSDGIVYDERAKHIGARNPAFGLTADGQIVMVIQRVDLLSENPEGLQNSIYLVSTDNGENLHSA
jgi:hypothetical protein